MLKRDEEEVVRRRWTPAAARAALAKWKASGLTKTAFVEQHGFTLERLRRWEKRLAEGGGSEPVRLVPLVARGASPPTSGVSAKLQMPGGVELDFDAARVDPRWVAALVLELTRGA